MNMSSLVIESEEEMLYTNYEKTLLPVAGVCGIAKAFIKSDTSVLLVPLN